MKASETSSLRLAMRPGTLRVASAFGVTLAYGVGFWLVLLRRFEGVHQSLLWHWLLGATIALPFVVTAVAAALRLGATTLAPRDGASVHLRRAIAVGVAAPAASLVLAASSVVQSSLFASTELRQLPLPLQLARDGLLSLAVAVPLAALVALVVIRDRSAAAWSVPRTRAVLLAAGATILAAALGGSVGAAADPGAGSPCPVGAPLKSFDVQAIDVDITLNRFGDHDPTGKMYVLSSRVAAVRAQEAKGLPNRDSIGLREDAIQPLALRANQGDCVEITFTNNASGGPYGVHLDGLSFESGSSGDAVGQNATSDVALGGTRTYRYFIPNDPRLEGAHYMRPGPGNRQAVAHGLFGALTVEPPGSAYLNMTDGSPLESGWEATIVPGAGKPSFREFVQIYHEVGDESFLISTKDGGKVPLIDPTTTSYRPASRAINYRSEPFMNRLVQHKDFESQAYGSYAFGDPATPMMRGYLKDPTKIRLVHGGGEMFHVFHLHGGGDRWRFNPLSDKTQNYADTGLNKYSATQSSPSTRLDSQAFGPGESYNLEIEGGAGGVQQAAGDFLYHCHIAEHYVSGMWSFWRVYDTSQPDLMPLPDRVPPSAAVDSAGLIGKTFNGMTITAANLDDWVRAQLPPQGVQSDGKDASVWNWTVDTTNPSAPVYLGEPEDKRPWPDLPNIDPAHPGSLITDLAPGQIVSTPTGDRPKIQFDPMNGRYAWPLMRPHVGTRPPFAANGHSGAPWLGENSAVAAPTAPAAVNPWAGRTDSICPAGAPVRKFNVVSITLPIQVTKAKVDPDGMLFTLAQNKDAVYAGTKPAEPLAIRSNIGDCDAVTLTSELTDASQASGFAKSNIHIHHVQFDPESSDGVITGMSYEQSVRPYKIEDPSLTADAAAGDTTLHLSDVKKFQHVCADGTTCDNVYIGIGLGTTAIEIRQIASVDEATSTVVLTKPLANAHVVGDGAGTEFTQYRWYPDVLLDNVFFHDHVDGIHNWSHGLVGQLIIEPAGSTYHDPKTGAEVDSGAIADIHTSSPLIKGVVDGSFREMALWTIDDNPASDSTLNLKADPWADRLAANADPSLLFSSYTHGDPITPLPLAYPGDAFVIRTINVGPTVDGLHVDGHRFALENRTMGANGKPSATQADTVEYGISERYSLVLDGGAGGPQHQPGDYLYENSVARKFRDGAWGILRVLPGQSPDLRALPGATTLAPATLPAQTGGRPPVAADTGDPCPIGANTRSFTVTAVDVSLSKGLKGPGAAFVSGSPASPITFKPDPLVLHAAVGDCVQVAFTNKRTVRSSFHLGMVQGSGGSSGVNAGFNPEQTVATGDTRTYRYYLDDGRYETALISDFGGKAASIDAQGHANPLVDPALDGMYGALQIAPLGATFTDPDLGGAVKVGPIVDVHVPGAPGYRDYTLFLADQDPTIGQNQMPYPVDVKGPATINYGTAGVRADGPSMFSSAANGGDPATPLLRAYPGDAMHVHAIGAPGNEQLHSFSLGGLNWSFDPLATDGALVTARGLAPMAVVDAHTVAGSVGDMFYGDLRRPFTVAGMWGLQRIVDPAGCPMMGLDRRVCGALSGVPSVTLTAPAAGALLSGNASVSASASDDVGVAGVQFQLDGVNLGAEATTSPYSVSWSTTTATNGVHTLSAIARDADGNQTTASIPVTVDNAAPTVSLTAPLSGATVSGPAVSVSANAADNVALAGVQFKLDGTALGSEITGSPFSVSWDSRTASNGPHTVSVVARDAAGNTSTASVTVTVSNAPPPVSSLVAAYGFNEGLGTAVGDASGLGNAGTTANTAWSASGKFGGALSFNGLNSMVSVASSASLGLTAGMTLEAWVDPSALGTTWRTAILKEKPAGMAYALYANNNVGKPNGQADVGGEQNVLGASGLAPNVWSHLAVTYDGSVLRLYVNGVLANTTLVVGQIGVSNGALRIGGNTVWNEWFKGLIDEVRIYSRALSAAQIQTDMTTPVGGSVPAPVDNVLPTVSMTAPASGATVSGATVAVSASAADNVGVAGVQFKLDGASLGAEDTAAPYATTWNSTSVANGSHTLSAVARDAAGNLATASITVTVSNAVTPPPPAGTVLLGNGATEAKVDSNSPGLAEAFKTTAGASGQVTRLRVFLDAGSTAGSVVLGLYTNAGGHPGTLLTSGTISAPVAGQNNEVTVAATAVTAGQTYWLAVLAPSGTVKFRDRGGVAAGSSEASQQVTLTALPATWTSGASFSDGLVSAVGIG